MAIVVAVFLSFLINLINDFGTYHSTVSNQTDFSRWYEDNRWKEPYTTFCLSQYPSKWRVTSNSIGDTWVVKETFVGKVEFWTVKMKIEKKDVK